MIVVLNDVSGRKKEMALYLTQGYTGRQVTGIILLEYAVRMLWAFLMAAIIAFAILTIADSAVEKIFGIEYGILHLGFEPGAFTGSIGYHNHYYAGSGISDRKTDQKNCTGKGIKIGGMKNGRMAF